MTENQNTWKTVFYSAKGTSHELGNLPCQDFCRVVNLSTAEGELLIAVCADGAGSAEHSDQGSQIACDHFVELCRAYLTTNPSLLDISSEVIAEWLTQIREMIIARADLLETPVRQLATTLLGCVIAADESLFVQIGDGAMVYRGDEGLECAFWPHSGEYANMTNFLTSEDYLEKFEWKIVNRKIDEFASFTDGLERLLLKFENQTVHKPSIEPMLNSMRSSENADEFFEPLRQFLISKHVNERTDDDKTLILATRLNNDEAVS